VDDADRRLIVATQSGLPLVPRPYDELARRLALRPAEVKSRLQRMLEAGLIRRIGAVPNHYAIGYKANGMSVWDVDDDRVDALGEAVGALEFVTHCYRRPRHLPHWPYNLFAMVHGLDRAAVEEHVARIENTLAAHCRAHDVLYSTRILKKTGLRIAG
jgi:DNA-binding Lrp family transcriptional regulator